MSNTNDVNFKGTDGDTEGHGAAHGRVDDASNDDVEGHGTASKPRVKLPEESSIDNDAEGHVAATNDPGKPRVKLP